MENLTNHFKFKDLLVWQKSKAFANKIFYITETLRLQRKPFKLLDQIDDASCSISQNIAEGKGRNTFKEFTHFCYIARGSLYESVTLLNIFHDRKWISSNQLLELEEDAFEIACMIKGLINSLSK